MWFWSSRKTEYAKLHADRYGWQEQQNRSERYRRLLEETRSLFCDILNDRGLAFVHGIAVGSMLGAAVMFLAMKVL